MKNLILIAKNMKTFILTRSMFFVIFICGQIVAMAVILAAMGVAQISLNENKDTNLYDDEIGFCIFLKDSQYEITGKQWIEKMTQLREWIGDDFVEIEMVSWTKGDENSYVSTMFCTEEHFSECWWGPGMPNYDELIGDEHIISVPKGIDAEPGEEIEFDGEIYKVKGIENIIHPVVPIGAVPEQNILTSTTLYTKGPISQKRAEEIFNKMNELFGEGIKVENYAEESLIDLQANNTGKYVVVISAIIILLNSFVCYRYILEYRKRWLGIVRMVGCPIKRAFGLYEGELMITLVFCAMLGTAFFRFVVYPVMCNRSPIYREIYNYSTYGFSIVVYLATAFIIITASIIPLVSKSVLELKKRD